MFESYAQVNKVNPRKKWTTLVAVGGQAALIAALVAVSMLFPAPVHVAQTITAIIAPPSAAAPPPPSGNHAPAAPKTPVRQFDPSKMTVPQNIPQQAAPTAAPVADTPPSISDGTIGGQIGGVTGGQVGGVLGGIIGAAPSAAPPPPPPPPPAPAAPSELHIGGSVQAARLISGPPPDYPYAAKLTNVHGDVVLNAIIGPDGKVQNLSLVSGPAVLVSAAMDAVKTWLYQPTVLNGVAVKVATQIVVHFQLT